MAVAISPGVASGTSHVDPSSVHKETAEVLNKLLVVVSEAITQINHLSAFAPNNAGPRQAMLNALAMSLKTVRSIAQAIIQ